MVTLFKPPSPVLIGSFGGGGSGGSSIVNNSSSVSINVDEDTGDSLVQITTNNKAAVSVDDRQYVIIGDRTGITPTKRLTIVDPLGQGIQLLNTTRSSAVNFIADSDDGLSIITSGAKVNLSANKVYLDNQSLYVGGLLVSATAAQMNYSVVTPGTAQAWKALVVDGSRNIANINSLGANLLTGVIQTPAQPNINSLNSVDISTLSLRGTTLLASATDLNFLKNATPGSADVLKAIVLDNNKSISGVNVLSAVSLGGTLLTGNQPNITEIGTLDRLIVNQTIGIGTVNPTKTLEVVSTTPVIRIGNHTSIADISLDSDGNLKLNPDRDVIIQSHKNLVFGGTSAIIGLNNLTANTITGTITTVSQPNITSIGTLSTLNVTGDVVIGTLDTASANKRLIIQEQEGWGLRIARSAANYCDFHMNTTGDVELIPIRDVKIPNGKALRMAGPIFGISDLTASTLTGTLLTSAQPNITSIGTLDTLSVTTRIETGAITALTYVGTLLTPEQPNITRIGTLASLTVTNAVNAGSVIANTLTGTLLTAAQPNITSIGMLIGLNVSNGITAGSITADTLSGTLLTATQPNITSIGTLSSLNVSNAIVTNTLTANSLTGTLLTPEQPNITRIGTLSTLTVTNNLTTSSVLASSLTGTILTASQPNITTIGTLSTLAVTNAITASSLVADTLSGALLTAAQPNITSIGTLNKLILNGPLGIGVTNPTSAIDINTSQLSIPAAINLNDGNNNAEISIGDSGIMIDTSGSFLTLGSGVSLRFVNGGITGLSSLTATQLYGTLMTGSQPNITSIGTLDYLDSGYIGLGTTHSSQYRLNVFNDTGKMLMLGTPTQTLNLTVVGDDYTINTSNKRLALATNVNLVLNGGTIIGLDQLVANTISGTLITPSQPNITSVGTLSSLTVTGGINAGSATLGSAHITGDITIDGALNLSTPLSFTNLSSSTATFNADIAATSSTNGGTFTVIGGAAFSKNVIIGTSLTLGSITLTEESFSGLISGAPGVVEPNKTLVPSAQKDLSSFRNLSAENLFGTIGTAYQPAITTVGNLTNLNVDGFLGVGTQSPMKQLEVNSSTGACLRLCYDKVNAPNAYVDYTVGLTGNACITPFGGQLTVKNRLIATQISLGTTTNTIMPLEVGSTKFSMTVPFAYNTSTNAHGVISASTANPTPEYDYSIRALGRILCTTSIDVMSDRRTKKNVAELTDEFCTSFVEKTTPVSFNWLRGDQQKSFGYIAQELLKNGFDELVNLAQDDQVEEIIDDDGFINPAGVKFTISYQNIIPILAQNQKRLMKENEDLRSKLDTILDLLQKK